MLEQLKRERDEEVEKVQHHLEVTKLAVRELEESMRMLQQASGAPENIVLTEVSANLFNERRLFDRQLHESVKMEIQIPFCHIILD